MPAPRPFWLLRARPPRPATHRAHRRTLPPSAEFRTRWAAHNVRFHRTGYKKLHHPAVGRLDLEFEAMEFPAHPGLTLVVYTAPADSPAADGLELVATWAATSDHPAPSRE
ncbi:MmyB family transcriptional regulator [Nocardia gipuzkoensis]